MDLSSLKDLKEDIKKADVKPGVTEETWMFKIYRYPNGESFPGKMWKVEMKDKNTKTKTKGKSLNSISESEVENI